MSAIPAVLTAGTSQLYQETKMKLECWTKGNQDQKLERTDLHVLIAKIDSDEPDSRAL